MKTQVVISEPVNPARFLIVYMSSSYDTYAMDAYDWAKRNGFKEEDLNANTVLSEKAFHLLMERNNYFEIPVYFVKDKTISKVKWPTKMKTISFLIILMLATLMGCQKDDVLQKKVTVTNDYQTAEYYVFLRMYNKEKELVGYGSVAEIAPGASLSVHDELGNTAYFIVEFQIMKEDVSHKSESQQVKTPGMETNKTFSELNFTYMWR